MSDVTASERVSGFVHAAADYTAEEMLLCYIAERLEVMADRMVGMGHRRIGLFGSREHAVWMAERIEAMSSLPIVAFVDRPDRAGERRDIGVPVFSIDDPGLSGAIDTLLIVDDRCEDALRELAERHLPGGTLVFTIYNRLAIGGESLGGGGVGRGVASVAEAKPAGGAGGVSPAASGGGAESGVGGGKLARLTAATVRPVDAAA